MSKPKTRKKTAGETPVTSIQLETPEFKNEAEEAAWWDEHSDMLTSLLVKYGHRAPVKTQSVTIRLPVRDVERARKIARKNGVGYKTLIGSLLHDAVWRQQTS